MILPAGFRAALPFAAFYGAVFLAMGIYLPFWPVFLEHRGLTAAEIGWVLALGTWAKTAVAPIIGHISDRTGQRRLVLAALAGIALLAASGYHFAAGFMAILAVHLIVFPAFQATIPLGESHCMAAVREQGLDYGRLRLWGSLAFILGVLGIGELLAEHSAEMVLWGLMGSFALLLLVTLALPKARRPEDRHGRAPILALIGDRNFLIFLVIGALLQSSHAVYYSFSAVHWQAAGHSAATVGWLWSEGVIAEVALFALGAALLHRLGPVGLLATAAIAGVLRWTVLAETTALPALVGVQALHAFTFGAAHLGAMHYIARRAPPGLQATAQGLYGAVSGGIGMGLALLLAGTLYEAMAGRAFHAMAAMSLVGGLLTIVLLARERSRNRND